MYRTSEEYDRMRKLVLSIYLDYGITINDFPLDLDKLCRKMQISVVPYSSQPKELLEILLKKSKDGFNIPRSNSSEAIILFNDRIDDIITPSRISQTKAHEIKHLLEGDVDDSEDDLCEYFGKYLRCPLPLVKHLGIKTKTELISKFSISDEQAAIVLSNLESHKKKFGIDYLDYEIILLKQLYDNWQMEFKDIKIVDSSNDSGIYFKDIVDFYSL